MDRGSPGKQQKHRPRLQDDTNIQRNCLALGRTGKVYAWGRNHHGQLGSGDVSRCNGGNVVEVSFGLQTEGGMRETGQALVTHPLIRAVGFTGSLTPRLDFAATSQTSDAAVTITVQLNRHVTTHRVR